MDFYAIVSIFDVLLNLFIALAIPFVSLDKLLIFGLLKLWIRAVVIFCMYFLFCKKRNFTALKIQDKLDKVFIERNAFFLWNGICLVDLEEWLKIKV